MEQHILRLKNMYLKAPINRLMEPSIEIFPSKAIIKMKAQAQYFHGGNSLHGSIYFKMLDDAAFFAVHSYVEDVFVFTTTFTTHMKRPFIKGMIYSEGRLRDQNEKEFTAESVLYTADGKEIGSGHGVFKKSKLKLADAMCYTS